jgi:transposase
MRYADGGGLTMEGRSRREQVRLQAAEMFEHEADARQIASSLRVSTKSVYQWRRTWQSGGGAALASKGPGGNSCKLEEEQIAELRAALEAGPGAYGWAQDQRWTLARVAALVMCLLASPARCAGCRSCLAAGRSVPWWGALSAAGAFVFLVGGRTVATALQPFSHWLASTVSTPDQEVVL